VGVQNSTKLNSDKIGYFNIPRVYYEKYGIKDCADYVQYFGIEALKELFIQKKVNIYIYEESKTF